MTRVRWTDPALEELQSIHDFISADSDAYAAGVIARILDATRRLEVFPESGRVVPEWCEQGAREIIVGTYRVVYEIRGAEAWILMVMHGARAFPPGPPSR